jgi:ribosomal protein L2
MAYLDTIKLVAGDTLPDIRFDLKDANKAATGVKYDSNDSSTWAPIDLTDGSARLIIREQGAESTLSSIAGIIQNATEGAVIFPLSNTPFESGGLYEGEVEISYLGGGVQTMYDLVKFKVRSDFD